MLVVVGKKDYPTQRGPVMRSYFELWDTETGNLVNSYPTLSDAALALQRAIAVNPDGWSASMALSITTDADREPLVIAEGNDIVDFVGQVTPKAALTSRRTKP
jgi:hypothetical protein